MLRKIAQSAFIMVVVLLASYNNTTEDHGDRKSQLVGDWDLLLRHECENYPSRSDHLTLRPDGTFDQYTVLKDGQKVDSLGKHWQYFEKNHIGLDSRRDWEPHSDPSLRKGADAPPPLAGVTEHEVLIVQFGSPPVILLNPDSDCVYVKTR